MIKLKQSSFVKNILCVKFTLQILLLFQYSDNKKNSLREKYGVTPNKEFVLVRTLLYSDQKRLCIWTLFTLWFSSNCRNSLPNHPLKFIKHCNCSEKLIPDYFFLNIKSIEFSESEIDCNRNWRVICLNISTLSKH